MNDDLVIRVVPYTDVSREELTKVRGSHADVSAVVSEILRNVREEGDTALIRYTERFDHVRLDTLKVSDEEYSFTLSRVEPEFIEVLEQAAANISRYHEQQRRKNYLICSLLS